MIMIPADSALHNPCYKKRVRPKHANQSDSKKVAYESLPMENVQLYVTTHTDKKQEA